VNNIELEFLLKDFREEGIEKVVLIELGKTPEGTNYRGLHAAAVIEHRGKEHFSLMIDDKVSFSGNQIVSSPLDEILDALKSYENHPRTSYSATRPVMVAEKDDPNDSKVFLGYAKIQDTLAFVVYPSMKLPKPVEVILGMIGGLLDLSAYIEGRDMEMDMDMKME